MKKVKKIIAPSTWDDCKTKEQKQAFKAYLEELDATGKFISFDECIFNAYIKELSR